MSLDDGLRVSARLTGETPSSAFLPSDGVDTVVVDDVETVLALHDVSHTTASTMKAPTRRAEFAPLSGHNRGMPDEWTQDEIEALADRRSFLRGSGTR